MSKKKNDEEKEVKTEAQNQEESKTDAEDKKAEAKEKENPLLEVMPGGMLYYHIDDPVIDLGDDTPDDMIRKK